MRKKVVAFTLMISAFASCVKEDDKLTLPPPGELTKVVAEIGSDYNKQVYVSLANNKQVTRNIKDWDLAFESSAAGFHVYLNSGKYMFTCHTGTNDFVISDTTGKPWMLDNDHLDDDSTAIGKWWENGVSTDEVLVIDRGRVFYTGGSASQRYKKLKLEAVTATEYHFSYCDFSNSTPVNFILQKNNSYSLMYFSFDNGGKAVEIAPPKNDWDVVFTRYTHTYFDQPLSSPFRYYLVSGALSNRWNNISGIRLIKDSTPGYIDYAVINGVQAANYVLSSNADFIGFDWKVVDNSFHYLILTSRYYLLKDRYGYFYKIRFIDFYNQAGQTGTITFDYQRL